MKYFKNELSLSKVADLLKIELPQEYKNIVFNNVSELGDANSKSICFYENSKYKQLAENSKAGLIFITKDSDLKSKSILLPMDKPYYSFITLVTIWLQIDNKNMTPFISETAKIAESAKVGQNVTIGHNVVIENDVIVDDNTIIEANSVIKENVKIGKHCHLYPNVTIYQDCVINNQVIIHSGAVIGADGFGFALINNQQIKIPQVGNVLIEDNVEIGACSCVDRATIGTTIVKKGTKIDNLVQVGHNCKIDEHSILCAQVGLAGNSSIGKTVYLAGQVGVAGHLHIEDNTMVGAQSGVASSIKTGKYFGTPVLLAQQQLKIAACLKDLPEITKFFKKMMREKV
ncbi:MAG: UDP-3-O-(3-hydroxymyristoyl)glucosamine N-acyltransferase [Candidatus Cloacimonadales bacterium]|jgi:UDP-3-O-[3-hydroxymyristoyl] glucosamine N-acyltransferase|nr:UDP-3-O-(3-hydroxymyristoyl)glucosamine N-acyltransferase [Candidatus Cloacimonadota bacterium]MDD2650931.1 UDP-3-O-(3-hydroxymyristoyl)glucosamine N-acyltransferase [Candidatus Cloacimonadota bacterium]MDX9976975.1 UDP-3-O-(3-hydroxymyristoyl)glucosamine N-acyltransferase [Candidatus Cloacimonadales bacterium]